MKKAKNKQEASLINKQYRRADCEQYKTARGVIGHEQHLSNNHPTKNICDELVGRYPTWFIFDGHSDECMCFLTAILCEDEDYELYLNAVLNGEGENYIFTGIITDVPESFKNWVRENEYFQTDWISAPSIVTNNYTKGDIRYRIDGVVKKKSFIEYLKTFVMTNKKLVFTLFTLKLAFLTNSCGDDVKLKDEPNNRKALHEIRKEQKIKEALITDANILYVSVIDDGSSRNGYAEYLCQVLSDHKATPDQVKVVRVNSTNDPDKDNAYGVLLGEAYCN